MVRGQMIQFLQATVVFLLLTNAASAIAAILAVSLASRSADQRPEAATETATQGRIASLLRRVGAA
jgi:hypothetical protein